MISTIHLGCYAGICYENSLVIDSERALRYFEMDYLELSESFGEG